jgi:iron complex transport system ATP-binding protein
VTAANTAAIRVKDLVVRFRARSALEAVTFDIATPGLVAIIGPNGAGKSTLLKSIAGLVPAHSGTIQISETLLHAMTPAQRATIIGYLPQERTVHWPLSARAIVELGRLPHQRPGAGLSPADTTAINAAITAMDVEALAERSVQELSGGERARVLIARVLAQEPSVILADEPSAGLDPQHQWALFEKLEATAGQGIRIIVALHDLALTSRFAKHVLMVAGGRLVAHGTPDDVLTPERLRHVFGISCLRLPHDGHTLVVPTGLTNRPT